MGGDGNAVATFFVNNSPKSLEVSFFLRIFAA